MEKIKIEIKRVLNKGFATELERDNLIGNCNFLEEDEIEEIREDLEKIEALPLEEVINIDDEEEIKEEEKENEDTLTREERRAKAREVNRK